MKFIQIFLLSLLLVTQLGASPSLESILPQIELSGDLGGRIDSSAWTSSEFSGRMQLVFYVDPDAADVNDPAAERLRAEDFPRDKIQSIAIINLAATWIPNRLVNKKLKSKQKKFPNTVYVRDVKKSLVHKWGYDDDASVVSLLDGVGRLVFYRAGKLNEEDIVKLISEIRVRVGDKP